MRYLVICFLALLAGCNGSSNSGITQEQLDAAIAKVQASIPPSQSTQVAALQASIKKLQLIGNAHGVATAERTLAIGEAAATAVNFGPCTDMGVLVGFTAAGNISSPDPLTASYQAFKQCTGYQYEVSTTDGSIKPAPRIFWDGPNCTGNMLEWQAGGANFNAQALSTGIVFLSPMDDKTALMVEAGQTPQPILIQSVMLDSDHLCQSDVETQLMFMVQANNLQTTGVPNSTVGNYSLAAP